MFSASNAETAILVDNEGVEETSGGMPQLQRSAYRPTTARIPNIPNMDLDDTISSPVSPEVKDCQNKKLPRIVIPIIIGVLVISFFGWQISKPVPRTETETNTIPDNKIVWSPDNSLGNDLNHPESKTGDLRNKTEDETEAVPSKINLTTSSLSSNCTSPDCHEAVEQLQLYMNESYRPCHNFYKYACGGWMHSHKATKDENSTQPFSEVDKSNSRIMQSVIESLMPNSEPEWKLKNFYSSCLQKQEEFARIDFANLTLPESASDEDSQDYQYPDDVEDSLWLKDWLNIRSIVKNVKHDLALEIDEQNGKQKNESLPLVCTILSKFLFADVTARLFVEKMYLDKQQMISDLLETVRESYLTKISRISWIDEESKHLMMDRIRSLRVVLGYPKSLFNRTAENERYKDIIVLKNQYILNFLTLINLVRMSPIDDEVSFTTVANAFYSPLDDKLVIPAGLSQKPFFDPEYPAVMNYGKFASTIGHEMTHAFHTYAMGSTSDLAKLKFNITLILQEPIISEESIANFQYRRQCVEDQYSGFHIENITIQGSTTVEENFSDIAGIQVSYKAFVDNYGSQFKPLPGLEQFTEKQLFFIAAAQVQCRSFSDDTTEEKILMKEVSDSVHSPNSVRVFGEMMNSVEFSEAFNCPVGSPYNPPQRCEIFDKSS